MAQVLPNGSLLLPAVGIQDEGTFQCRAMSRKGKETKSDYQVRVYRKSSRAFPKAHLSFKEKHVTPAPATSAPVCRPLTWAAPFPSLCESSKSQNLIGISPPSEIPGKPEIVDPASELTAGVPRKVVEETGGRN